MKYMKYSWLVVREFYYVFVILDKSLGFYGVRGED